MIPIFQTIIDPITGNCFPACIASILEIPLESVPHFNEESNSPNKVMKEADQWLAEHFGLTMIRVSMNSFAKELIIYLPLAGTLMLVSGRSQTFEHGRHVVVGRIVNEYGDWKLVHDPNPAGKGIKGDPSHYVFFAAVDPAKVRDREKL